MRRSRLAAFGLVALLASSLGAQERSVRATPLADLERVPRPDLPKVDPVALRRADEERVARGETAHYAAALEVDITPWSGGAWEILPQGVARWRLRLRSPGALSLNLAFTRFSLPVGARLTLLAADGSRRLGPFTEHDGHAEPDGSAVLWTPPLATDDLVLELTLPIDRLDALDLHLTRLHHGYAGFGAPAPRSGSCQVDIACAPERGHLDAARAVGLVSIEGIRFCTGFLVNNTAGDGRPFFLTAKHCGITARNAASVVVMWDLQQTRCGAEPAPTDPLRIGPFQSGAVLRAVHPRTDLVLLELDTAPSPESRPLYAGWDRSDNEPVGTFAVHHPNTDAKRIAIDLDRAVSTPYLRKTHVPDSSHLRIANWERGTTEGGSSGAPLFNRNLHVVGLLNGGWAACGNGQDDWFGRLSAAWDGPRADRRLRDWLDPVGNGAVTLDGLDPLAPSDTPPPIPEHPASRTVYSPTNGVVDR